MDIPEGDVRFACTQHGAKAVLEAAYKRMAGDHRALPAVGLPDTRTFRDADRIGQVCCSAMTAAERRAALAEIAVTLARRRRRAEGTAGPRRVP